MYLKGVFRAWQESWAGNPGVSSGFVRVTEYRVDRGL